MSTSVRFGSVLFGALSLGVAVASCSSKESAVLFNDGTSGQGEGGSGGRCLTAGDCNDLDACTTDTCSQEECVHTPMDPTDGDVCTVDACDSNTGIVHVPLPTDDGDPCTADACDPVTGPIHTPADIDDKNVCTTDSCDPVFGVVHMQISCDDADACTVDTCDPVSAACAHSPEKLDDNDVCTVDSCDKVTGVSHAMMDISDGLACTDDVCDPMTGEVTHPPATCDDNSGCTADSCDPAVGCINSTITYFVENFADNSKGWALDTGWQIGQATKSSGQDNKFGTDPAEDHSPTNDDGIAGTFIGGNIPKMNTGFQYLTSPVIDISAVTGPVYLEIWRVLNSDYPPYADSNLQVFDATMGGGWTTMFSVPNNGPEVSENTQASPGWVRITYDVSVFKSAMFQVRFGYSILNDDEVYTSGGWNLDDIRLVPGNNCP